MSSNRLTDEDHPRNERQALLGHGNHTNGFGTEQSLVSAQIARRLYVSHFLSTWNSRLFEFGAVLYLATVFPGTLLPLSVYALTRSFAAIALASAVGHYIDVGNRLQVVRTSIGKSHIYLRRMLVDLPSFSTPGRGHFLYHILPPRH